MGKNKNETPDKNTSGENINTDTNIVQGNETQVTTPPGDNANKEQKTEAVMRHKTTYKHYRRAGIVLEQIAKPYSVTAAQLEILKKDPHVEIIAK